MAKILVVDDVRLDRVTLCNIITKAGHTTLEAGSAEEAIVMAKEHHPAVIFLDVMMLPVNGFEACRTLSRDDKTKDIPVVMCTAKDKGSDKAWASRQGSKYYIVKPASEQEVFSILKELGL